MPAHIGQFTLVRSWNDTLIGGTIVYTWGDYALDTAAGPGTGVHVAVGISPQLGVHDAEVCHIARGEDPNWHGQISTMTPGGEVVLTAASYNDGVTQRLEASTVCDSGHCQQFTGSTQHVTLIYAAPHKGLPLRADTTRSVPVLLKVESSDTVTPSARMEPQLAAILTRFLEQADLVQLTAPYSRL